MSRRTTVVPARLDAFPRLGAFLEEMAKAAGLTHEDGLRLRLVVEELFTNTVTHGHRGDSDAPITVSAESREGSIDVTYEDTAPPFDPVAASRSRDEGPVETVGGRGVLLVIRLADHVSYTRAENRNRISLVLRASGSERA